MNSIKSVINNFESFSDNDKVEILLYGDSHLDNNKNKYILEATLNYVNLWFTVRMKYFFLLCLIFFLVSTSTRKLHL